MPETMIDAWECCRCGKKWPKKDNNEKPITCPYPKCRSPYWDKEKRLK